MTSQQTAPAAAPRQKTTFKAWGAEIRRDLRSDHTGLQPLPAGADRTATRAAVWISIATLYWVGWGEGLRNAFIALGNLLAGKHLQPQISNGANNLDAFFDVSRDFAVAAIGAAVILLLLRRVPRIHWRRAGEAFALAPIATTVGFLAAGALAFLPQNNYPFLEPASDPTARVLAVASSIAAGPAEEIVLLGLVVIGLRVSGYRWAVVFTVAAVLRVPFHLYYGPGAVLLAVWPLLMVLAVRRLGLSAIVGAIAAHSLWDASADLDRDTGWVWRSVPAVIGVVLLFLWARRRDKAA